MKQVLQNLRTGKVEVADVPAPAVRPAHLLVRTAATLISPGTERMLVEFGQSGLLGKARAQPEKVRQLVTKIRTDGVKPALEAVASRLEEPLPLGYSNVGRVLEAGAGVTGFVPGQRVLTNGPHAGIVCVPATLSAPIPDEVDDASASFGVLGAIALNGVRLLEPTLGETFAVVGLGVLGLLGVQLLRAHGCRVLAIDVDAERCKLARTLGADAVCVARDADPVRAALAESQDRGVDGVLITATAKGNAVVHQAAQMCRKRGRMVLVGVVGLELERAAFYEKELSFRVACSYGPGRYDASYEAQGRDYPVAFVRWTAARNFAAVLDALARRTLDVGPLISRRVAVADAERAYDAILADRSALGVVLEYPDAGDSVLTRAARVTSLNGDVRDGAAVSTVRAARRRRPRTSDVPVVGVIGAGQFARLVLLPAIQAAGARIAAVASAGGVTCLHAARRFGAAEATTDVARVLESPDIDCVFIATRHDSHADLVVRALDAGKHVFVEKPLAIDDDQLARVVGAYHRAGDAQLMVGFNRRFAPCAVQAKRLLAGRAAPVTIDMMVNAGALPIEHWTRDRRIGGGRIVGEGCHFVDLALFLVGSPIVGAHATGVAVRPGAAASDDATLCLEFADGSLATIAYRTGGPKSFPKERVEIFADGRALVIDNWRALRAFDWPGVKRPRPWAGQDKGHRAEVAAFLDAVRSGGDAPIPFAELVSVSETSLALARQLAGDDVAASHAETATDETKPAAVAHDDATGHEAGDDESARAASWRAAAGEGLS
jgi:predicted dehydrogenase/threonine dehydrogenase-like Zn-dependent dehydrogenase